MTNDIDLLKDARLIQRIKDALGTEEEGMALVEVARNAHRAELELATIKRRNENDDKGSYDC